MLSHLNATPLSPLINLKVCLNVRLTEGFVSVAQDLLKCKESSRHPLRLVEIDCLQRHSLKDWSIGGPSLCLRTGKDQCV